MVLSAEHTPADIRSGNFREGVFGRAVNVQKSI